MVANIRGYTPNYSFKLVNFDTPRWHTLEYANWNQLDAILTQAGIAQVRGEWQYGTTYLIGDRVFDAITNDLFRCLVQHTSATSGTFEQDRILHPSYWALQLPGVPLFRGAWTPVSVYSLGDIVYTDEYTYRLCTIAHTSSPTFPPDQAAGYWQIIFTAEAAVDAAAQSAFDANNSAVAAAGSANSASGSEQAALAHKNAAATSATNAATSATASANSATASATSATESAASAVTSGNYAADSLLYSQNSANSAVEAANQAQALRGTSTSTNELTNGFKLFETQAGKHFYPGTFLTIVNGNDITTGLACVVQAYSGTTLQCIATGFTGTGVSSNWLIYVSGSEGLDGTAGIDGQPGADGDPGLVWKGNWNSTTNYILKDAVAHLGSSYIAVVANINSAPPSVNWGLMAQGGSIAIADDQVLPSNLDADTAPKQLLFRDRLNFVSRSGDTIDGTLGINYNLNVTGLLSAYGSLNTTSIQSTGIVVASPDPIIGLSKDAGSHAAFIQGRVAGIPRWNILLGDYSAEGAGNTGSNFAIQRKANDGSHLGQIYIDRSNGEMVLEAPPTSSLGAATKSYVDAVNNNAVLKNVTAQQTMIGSLGIQSAGAGGSVLALQDTVAGTLWNIAASGGNHGAAGDLSFWNHIAGTRVTMQGGPSGGFLSYGNIHGYNSVFTGYATPNSGIYYFGNDGTRKIESAGTDLWFTGFGVLRSAGAISVSYIYTSITGTPEQGSIQFGNTGTKSLYFNGTDFYLGNSGGFYNSGIIQATATDFPLRSAASTAAGHARIMTTVPTVRQHSIGTQSDGRYVITDLTASAERLQISSAGDINIVEALTVAKAFTCNATGLFLNDLTVRRAFAPTTGLIQFGNTGTKYLYFDGGTFNFVGGPVSGGEPTATNHLATKTYVDTKVSSGAFLPLAGGTMTGKIYTGGGIMTTMAYSGSGGSVEFVGAGGGADSMISFHRPGAFACNMGLNAAQNNLSYGGWSYGPVDYTIWSTRQASGITVSMRLVYVGDYTHAYAAGMVEPYGSSVHTGMGGLINSNIPMRYRQAQILLHDGAWYPIGYA